MLVKGLISSESKSGYQVGGDGTIEGPEPPSPVLSLILPRKGRAETLYVQIQLSCTRWWTGEGSVNLTKHFPFRPAAQI